MTMMIQRAQHNTGTAMERAQHNRTPVVTPLASSGGGPQRKALGGAQPGAERL